VLKKKITIQFFLLILVGTTLLFGPIGCGQEGSEVTPPDFTYAILPPADTASETNELDRTKAPSSFSEPLSELEEALTGTWRGPCSQTDSTQPIFTAQEAHFEKRQSRFTVTTYKDSECKKALYTRSFIGLWKASEIPYNSSFFDVKNLDLFVRSILLMVLTEEGINEELKSESECLTAPLKINQPINLTGHACWGETYPAVGDLVHDIYAFIGNGLFFGKKESFKAYANTSARPTRLDDQAFLKK